MREVGHRGEVALAGRAERAHARQAVLVEGVDDERRELGTHARRALHEPVGKAQQRGTHNLVGHGRADGDEVIEDQPPVEQLELRAVHAHALAHADASRDAVSLGARLHCPLDRGTGAAHAVDRSRSDADACALAGDRHDLVEREGRAVDLDGHAARLGRNAGRRDTRRS